MIRNFLWKTKRDFKKGEFIESIEECINPGRGWYQVYTFLIEEEIDFDSLNFCLKEEETLALVMIDIGACNTRILDEIELQRIKHIFEFFKKNGKDMILRIVYDREGEGLKREPCSFSLVQLHMKQLGNLFASYADSILVIQGLFVGSWGEMHTSKFLSEKKMVELARLLYQETEQKCFMAVRKPVQWRVISSSNHWAVGNVGLYNDGLFASETHLGTFGEVDHSTTNWGEPWNPADEMKFINEHFYRTPNGGEAVKGNDLDCQRVINTLQEMHICYLNRVYDEQILNDWKSKEYQKINMYSYIGSHLGYRFVVRDAAVKKMKSNGNKGDMIYHITIEIENVGFGNLCQAAELYLIVNNEKAKKKKFLVDTDARNWDSGKCTKVTVQLERSQMSEELGKGQGSDSGLLVLSLSLCRKHDGKVIYFSNQNAKETMYIGTIVCGK